MESSIIRVCGTFEVGTSRPLIVAKVQKSHRRGDATQDEMAKASPIARKLLPYYQRDPRAHPSIEELALYMVTRPGHLIAYDGAIPHDILAFGVSERINTTLTELVKHKGADHV